MTVPPAPTRAPRAESPGTGGRARPLPPAQRRAALIAATLPLVSRYGLKVTTRQIAEAAGVAEGTIFRVFPDKDALINAAVAAALDPLPFLAELAGIDGDLPLRERLTTIVRISQRRLTAVTNLLIAIGRHHPPPHDPGPHDSGRHDSGPHGAASRPHHPRPRHEPIDDAVTRALEPDQEQFRYPVAEVARMLRLLTFSATHPLITDGEPLAAEQITSILLDGVLRRP